MASVLPVPSTTEETTTIVPAAPLHKAPGSSASVVVHVVPAREQVKMGRKATVVDGVNWTTLLAMGAFHAAAVAALFFFTWQRLAVSAILYILAINVGIGMCYHRLLTHRGYHVPKWLEYVMTVCATLSLGRRVPTGFSPASRASSDERSRRRSAHAARGWMVGARGLASRWKEPALADRGSVTLLADLRKDKFHHVWLSKYHWVPVTLSGVLLLAGGWYFGGLLNGIAMVLWGVGLRVTLGLHATWSLNSRLICGAAGGLRRKMIRGIAGGWLC